MGQLFHALTEEDEGWSGLSYDHARELSTNAMAEFAEQFKRAGFKILHRWDADGWGISSLSIQMLGLSVPVHIGVQPLPKGVQLHVEFQSPLSRGDADAWEKVWPQLLKASKVAGRVFGEGGADVNVKTKGRDNWPYVWIFPGKSAPDDIENFPKRMKKFAADVANRVSELAGE
jgi:hypothetical protein